MAALLISMAPAPSSAGLAPVCTSEQGLSIKPERLGQPGRHWACGGGDTQGEAIGKKQGFANFDLAPTPEFAPRFLVTRVGEFDSIYLTVVDADGRSRTRTYNQRDVTLISGEPLFLVALPAINPSSRALFLQVDDMRHDLTLIQATLQDEDPSRTMDHYRMMMFMCLLMGAMLAPILFDIAAWNALRSPFILWHAMLAIAFSVLVFIRTGLVVEFFELSMGEMRVLLIMSLGFAAWAACMFTQSFIEKGRMDERVRKLLPWVAGWAVVASIIHSANVELLAPLGGGFHSFAMAPVLIILIAAMVDAFRKGSRAIRFQAIGWIPLLLAFAVQLISQLLPFDTPTDALPLFYLGVVSETAVTALGVADRFFTLRRERDAAVSEAQALGQLTERDPLTGLLNRRAIDARFSRLHADGYETFALLDLDHFKRVNDTAGHATGDKVLQVVAQVLSIDADSIAIRMGGEEFFLLMRGDDCEQRLAHLREQMSIRVAHEVPKLEIMVTASVGLVFAPHSAVPKAAFSHIYNHADRLLYDAKEQGRNRVNSERLQGFDRRKGDRREAKPGRCSAAA